MKNKKTIIFLVCLLVITSFFSIKYMELRQDNINLIREEKSFIASELSQSASEGYGLDLNKVSAGDKDSILSLLNMYEDISNCNAVLRVNSRIDASVLDPIILPDYQMALKDIINKSVNGKLKPEDADKFNIITADIKLIYNYVYENESFNYDKFHNEVEPKLKFKNPA